MPGTVDCMPSTDWCTPFNAVLFTVFTVVSLDETPVCTPFKVAVANGIFLSGEVFLCCAATRETDSPVLDGACCCHRFLFGLMGSGFSSRPSFSSK